MRRVLAALMVFVPVLLIGCGSSDGTVAGDVTYKGQKLNLGNITFVGADGNKSYSIAIDGSYKATGLRPGKYKVSILTPKDAPVKVPAPVGGKKTVEKGPQPVVIDDRYAKVETSGLEYDIKAGSQTINIDLK